MRISTFGVILTIVVLTPSGLRGQPIGAPAPARGPQQAGGRSYRGEKSRFERRDGRVRSCQLAPG